MRNSINQLLAYFKAVFIETWNKIFTIFDILGLFLFFYPHLDVYLKTDEKLIRTVGAVIILLSFLIANFSLYRKLILNISHQANIRLEVLEKGFGSSKGSRNSFRGIQKSQSGFNRQGLPDWGTLWANIEIVNIGNESGKLIFELDPKKLKLPSLFACDKTNIDFHPPLNIEGRKPYYTDLYFDIQFTEQDPHVFAQELNKLVRSKKKYQVVIRYRTKRIDGKSSNQELRLTGDFQDFYQEILKYWNDSKFTELGKLAQLS